MKQLTRKQPIRSTGKIQPSRAVAWTTTSLTQWMRALIVASGGNPSEVPDEPFRLVRMTEVAGRVGLHPATIYRRIAAGTFPSPIALGGEEVRRAA